MRLAVVGSTNITDHQRGISSIIIDGFLNCFIPDEVISGGAIGIDKLAEARADSFGFSKRIYLPENQRWAPRGYKVRNLLIAANCTHLLCIRSSQSTTYGSGWTADRAEEMGKTVWRVTV